MKNVYHAGLREGTIVLPVACDAEVVPCDAQLMLHHPEDGRELPLRVRITEVTTDPPGTRLELVAKTGLANFVLGKARIVQTKEAQQSVIEKLRKLKRGEQIRMARSGEQPQRVALERLLGKDIWEPLLHNPKITIPEVARIARKGTCPTPLLDLIVDNKSWAKSPPIRRALLTNPRLSHGAARRVLSMAPKPELRVAAKQMAYPAAIRELARKMSGGG